MKKSIKVVFMGALLIGGLMAQNAVAIQSAAEMCPCSFHMQVFDPYHPQKTLMQKLVTVPEGLVSFVKRHYVSPSHRWHNCNSMPLTFRVKLNVFSFGIGLASGVTVVPLYAVIFAGNHFVAFEGCHADSTISFTAGATAGLAGACYALHKLI